MSLVIDAPEAVLETDEQLSYDTARPLSMPISHPRQGRTQRFGWLRAVRALLTRLTPVALSPVYDSGQREHAVDMLARKHPSLYIELMSG